MRKDLQSLPDHQTSSPVLQKHRGLELETTETRASTLLPCPPYSSLRVLHCICSFQLCHVLRTHLSQASPTSSSWFKYGSYLNSVSLNPVYKILYILLCNSFHIVLHKFLGKTVFCFFILSIKSILAVYTVDTKDTKYWSASASEQCGHKSSLRSVCS